MFYMQLQLLVRSWQGRRGILWQHMGSRNAQDAELEYAGLGRLRIMPHRMSSKRPFWPSNCSSTRTMKHSSALVLFFPFLQYIPRVPRAIISLPWYILAVGGKTDSIAAALLSSRANAMLKDFSIS